MLESTDFSDVLMGSEMDQMRKENTEVISLLTYKVLTPLNLVNNHSKPPSCCIPGASPLAAE